MTNIKKIISQYITPSVRLRVRSTYQSLLYSGNAVFCPCCGESFRKFLPNDKRQNARCPKCHALERHRLLWLYLQRCTNFFSHSLRVLHIAPEELLQRKFKQMKNLQYLSVDLESAIAMVKMDITNIPHPDASFDVIFCSHVLEHIPDDATAMNELYRVLAPGGWAILQSPIDLSLEQTVEDSGAVISKEERKRLFGQEDHVRLYGKDYVNRLQNAGFTVVVDEFVRHFAPDDMKRFGLLPEEDLYLGMKQ